MLRNIYRTARDGVMVLIKYLLFLIPKDNNLIVANAWFGQKYADNTMYEFEYLLTHTNYRLIWTTKNRKVYEQLKAERKPVVLSNSPIGLWTQIRAKMLLSTIQENDYNKFFLCNCILLDLDHGIIFKQVGFDINPNDYQLIHDKIVKKFVQYYMTTPSYLTEKMMEHSYHITEDNIILCGKARFDYFFDEGLRKENASLKRIIGNRKTILYMPTHRSCGEKQMNMVELLDLPYINELCEKYGYVFIIKKHFYHRNEGTTCTSKYSNIVDITDSTFDAQELLYHADVLITDYSSCYIDYLLLNRPLILYTYDLDDYLKEERGLFISFNDLDIGYQPLTKSELNEALIDIVSSGTDRFKEKRERVKSIYFDESLAIGEARKEICLIIQKLMTGQFKMNWGPIAERELSKPGVADLVNSIKAM